MEASRGSAMLSRASIEHLATKGAHNRLLSQQVVRAPRRFWRVVAAKDFGETKGSHPSLDAFRGSSVKHKAGLESDGVKRIVSGLSAAAVALSLLTFPENALAQALRTTPVKLTPAEISTVNLFKENTPSVVYVTNLAVRRDQFTLDIINYPQGTGSGFVWDADGHIVTNFHVIRGASNLQVTFQDQSVFPARVVGFDEDKDVAVLQTDAPKDTLKPIKFGKSESLQVGQSVYAIGNPFGLDHTLTTGIISGLNREIASSNSGRPIQNVIQTDAAINPGNSGGPLLNSSGSLIGINTAIYSGSGTSSGVGFAIPSDTVVGIVDQIIKFGRVTRPVIGISFAPDVSVEQLGLTGVLVLDATPGGPASRAGVISTKRDQYGRLMLGDIITGINNEPIKNSSDLFRVLDKCKVGQQAELEVLRGEGAVKLQVTLDDAPTRQQMQIPPALLQQLERQRTPDYEDP
mmetsp:Transcript_19593/g.32915  ORF Transcript_19593/g.32915 Transcript_19593/m.32915 type:complete len:461 (-) Transcript_19593:371-1753(-)